MHLTVFLLAAAILAVQAQNPHPIPVPISNYSYIEGEWYMVLEYNSDFDNMVPIGLTCAIWNIGISDDDVTINIADVINGKVSYTNMNFAINSSKWIEQETGTKYAWIAIEPVTHNWAVFSSMDFQQAFLFTRNQTVTSAIVTQVITILKQEGYIIDSENYYVIDSTDCQQPQMKSDWYV